MASRYDPVSVYLALKESHSANPHHHSYSHGRSQSPYASSTASASGDRYSRGAGNPYSAYSGDSYARNSSAGGYGYGGAGAGLYGNAGGDGSFRSATPNRKGQYSAQVLEELESQNDAQVEGLSAKVKMLKDVCGFPGLVPSNCIYRHMIGKIMS